MAVTYPIFNIKHAAALSKVNMHAQLRQCEVPPGAAA